MMLAIAALALSVAAQAPAEDRSWGKQLPDEILRKAVLPDDYPIQSLVHDEVGRVRFGVVVGTDGRVKTCTILGSSGHPRLDAQTCAIMQARLRFKPALDAQGQPTEDRFWGGINWILQSGAQR